MNNSPLFSNKRIFKYSLLIGYCLYDRLRRFPPNKLPRPLTLRQTHCRFFLVDHSYDTYINQIKIKNVVSHKRGSFVFYLSHDPWQTHTHTHPLFYTQLVQHPNEAPVWPIPTSFAKTKWTTTSRPIILCKHTHTHTHAHFLCSNSLWVSLVKLGVDYANPRVRVS